MTKFMQRQILSNKRIQNTCCKSLPFLLSGHKQANNNMKIAE